MLAALVVCACMHAMILCHKEHFGHACAALTTGITTPPAANTEPFTRTRTYCRLAHPKQGQQQQLHKQRHCRPQRVLLDQHMTTPAYLTSSNSSGSPQPAKQQQDSSSSSSNSSSSSSSSKDRQAPAARASSGAPPADSAGSSSSSSGSSSSSDQQQQQQQQPAAATPAAADGEVDVDAVVDKLLDKTWQELKRDLKKELSPEQVGTPACSTCGLRIAGFLMAWQYVLASSCAVYMHSWRPVDCLDWQL
jgi:hypothetical protein